MDSANRATPGERALLEQLGSPRQFSRQDAAAGTGEEAGTHRGLGILPFTPHSQEALGLCRSGGPLLRVPASFSCPHLRIFSPLRLPPVGKWGGDPSESPDSHRARHPLNSEPLPLPRCPFILVPQPAGNHGSLASPHGLAKKKTPKQCFLHFPRQHGGVIARRLRRFADTK